MIARNRGRASGGRFSGTKFAGSNDSSYSSPSCEPDYMQRIRCGLMMDKSIQHPRNFHGDARAHQDITHSGKHGSIQGREMRHLDFFEVIDAHRIVVAFARKKHFHKIGHEAELFPFPRAIFRRARAESCRARSRAFRLECNIPARCGPPFRGLENGQSARRMCPPGSPSCNRLARIWSSAVPETTPRWPSSETARASRQFETPAPIPP